MVLSHSKRRRIVRWGAIFVLLMVMLPSITYVGHWDPLGVLPTHAHSLHHDPLEYEEHAAHCHMGPSTCTGPQATVGSWWIGDEATPLVAAEPRPALHFTASPEALPAHATRTVPPPRFA